MFAMCRCNVNTAAAADTVGVSSCVKTSRQCADTNIAMTLDAALLASIFVALISLLDILCLSLSLGLLALLALLSLILRGAAARLKDPSPCLL
ncbi:MAG: hypothetical protein MSK63_02865 [Clostridiales bacterium]|nr:hypothetical protein [Clostridiales bacterium]